MLNKITKYIKIVESYRLTKIEREIIEEGDVLAVLEYDFCSS